MKKSIVIKKSVSFLLSAAMIITGFFNDSLWMTVQAEAGSNTAGIETSNAYESGFSSDSPLKNLPVLNNVQVRNTEDEEQTELYRCSIPVGHPIELKDILIASGFLEEEDVEDYLSSLKDVSFREEGALRVYSDEENVWYVQAKDNFDNEESIILVDENDIESEIVITDRTVQPVVTLFAEEDDMVHTGSVSFKAEEGFGEDAEVFAELNDNQDAVNAVKASTVIYADYYTFDLGCSEEKAGYEVSMVFPLAVQGKEYRLFHVGEEGVTEYTENVSVTTVEGEEGDQAAAVTFLTDRLDTFVFACTKEFEYQIEEKPYEFTITESDPVNLRDVLITSGLISEEYADIFMTYIQSVSSADPEVLDVVLEEEVCTIVPKNQFETVALTVTMLDGQNAEISVADARKEEESVALASEDTYYKITWINREDPSLAPNYVLKSENVREGDTPEYGDGPTPEKPADPDDPDGRQYAFIGWDPEVEEVYQDTEYRAVFAKIFKVTWLDGDGNVLAEDSYNEGTKPQYNIDDRHPEPTKTATAEYTYSFNGKWDPDITEETTVTADITYTAQFDGTKNKYTVKWVNYDESTLETDSDVEYGELAEYNGKTDPYRPADHEHSSYSFSGWKNQETGDPYIKGQTIVTGDVTYIAVFTSAALELFIRDAVSSVDVPIKDATFELYNSEDVRVWSATTGNDGTLEINLVDQESEDCGGAAFEIGSTYKLVQKETDEEHFNPEGYWTFSVTEPTEEGKERAFEWTVVKDPLDFSTFNVSGPFNIRYYISNAKAAFITFDYNYPEEVEPKKDPVTYKMDFLQYEGEYLIELEDPDLSSYGYDFVGWVDSNNNTWKYLDTVPMNTINIKQHNMTATWRAPLNIAGLITYTGSENPRDKDILPGTNGIFTTNEVDRDYTDLSKLGKAYGDLNPATKVIADNTAYDFAFAELTHAEDDHPIRLTAVRYDSADHKWQYQTAESSNWIDIAIGDQVKLYYSSNSVKVVWMKEADGIFEPLGSSLTQKTFSVKNDKWYTADDLFLSVFPGNEHAKIESIIENNCYFHYFGLGQDDVSEDSQLIKGSTDNLQDFQLKNSETGILFRDDSSSSGSKLEGFTTIYLIYSETPPEGSAKLDIENNTKYPYQINALNISGTDILSKHKTIQVDEDGLLTIFDGETSWTSGKHASLTIGKGKKPHLILIGSAGKDFVIDGGFTGTGDAPDTTKVSVGVGSINTNSMIRQIIRKDGPTGDELPETKKVSKGTLDPESGKTLVYFDEMPPERSLTVSKVWSQDVDPTNYTVGVQLYEIGLGENDELPESIPIQESIERGLDVAGELRKQKYTVMSLINPDTRSGNYQISKDSVVEEEKWKILIPELPQNHLYYVLETSVTEKNVSGDQLYRFTPSYAFNDDLKIITVSNKRSDPVCRVGTEQFQSIKAAVEYITAQHLTTAKIEMIQDYIIPEVDAVVIHEGYEIELTTASDVEGLDKATVSRGFNGGNMLTVQGKLTVDNLIFDGKVGDTQYRNIAEGGLVNVEGNGELIVRSEAVFQHGEAKNGSAIYAENGGKIRFTGGKVMSNNATDNGGAIGVGGTESRIFLSGNVFIYNNRKNNKDQYNIYMDQMSDEVIHIDADGLGNNANVGVYSPGNDTEEKPYKYYGRPAKTFATYDNDQNLDKLINDRYSASPAGKGHTSPLSQFDGKVIWGETFSFTVNIQWLDEYYKKIAAPGDASVTLKLVFNNGSTTPGAVGNTAVVSSEEGWTHVFEGLACYGSNGKPGAYAVQEILPDDIKGSYIQIIFKGDRGYDHNLLKYSSGSLSSQIVTISNRYRYTTFKVIKKVEGLEDDQNLASSFSLFRIKKYDVGSVEDLPNGLRDIEPNNQWENAASYGDGQSITLKTTSRFFTVCGGNTWYCQVSGESLTGAKMKEGIDSNISANLVKFHKFYDLNKEEVSDFESGDVKLDTNGNYYVYNGSTWFNLTYIPDTERPDVRFSYTRQDGVNGPGAAVSEYGAQSTDKKCTINTTGNQTEEYLFGYEQKLDSEYYYYAVETGIKEGFGSRRTLSGDAELIATYNPNYFYDQGKQSVTVTNSNRFVLAVEKQWNTDGARISSDYDVYRLSESVDLHNSDAFTALVKGIKPGDEERVITVDGKDITCIKVPALSFRLPDNDNDGRSGSLIHVVTTNDLENAGITGDDLNATYFAIETKANENPIENPDTDENNVQADAIYKYDRNKHNVNLITVTNVSSILCKVTDPDGHENPFRRIRDAYNYGVNKGYSEFAIEMLRDYSIPNDDTLQIGNSKKVTLTTAATEGCQYNYQGGEGVTRATITRSNGMTTSFVTVTGENAGNISTTGLTLSNIEFDGNNLSASSKGGFVNASYATVILTGEDQKSGVKMSKVVTSAYGGAVYTENCKITINHAVFDTCSTTGDNNSGGGIYAKNQSMTISNSSFINCVASHIGGAIRSEGCSTTINSSQFDRCKSLKAQDGTVYDFGGGAVFIDNISLVVTETDFTNCESNAYGAAIMSRHGSVTIGRKDDGGEDDKKCKFNNNKAKKGGSILVYGNVQVIIHNCEFDENTANSTEGGAIFHMPTATGAAGSSTEVKYCSFTKCKVLGNGSGGALQSNALSLNVEKCTFTECNTARKQGGAIQHFFNVFKPDSVANIKDCKFSKCSTLGKGNDNAYGGAINTDAYTATIENCIFEDCSAKIGGALSNNSANNNSNADGKLEVKNCEFKNTETTAGNGGAVFSTKKTVEFTDSNFENCTSKADGGGIYHTNNSSGGKLTLSNCSFENCSAIAKDKNGGGVWTNSETVEVIGRGKEKDDKNTWNNKWKEYTFNNCNAYKNGGGIYHDNNKNETKITIKPFVDENLNISSRVYKCSVNNESGGGIYTTSKTIQMTDTEFTECKALNGSGGGVNVNNEGKSNIILHNCDFSQCQSKNNGGALQSNGLTAWLKLCDFNLCSTKKGGAVSASKDSANSELKLEGCTFTECSSADGGGAVFAANRTVKVNDYLVGIEEPVHNVFTHCVATGSSGDGGAICHAISETANINTEIDIVNAEFYNCESGRYGGAVSTNAIITKSTECYFDNCKASNNGGGINSNNSNTNTKTDILGSTFNNCISLKKSGGGVYSTNHTLHVKYSGEGENKKASEFINCKGKEYGGGIYHYFDSKIDTSGTSTILEKVSFNGCQAEDISGGGISVMAKSLTMNECEFLDCYAKQYGGGVNQKNFSESSVSNVSKSKFENCVADTQEGGGLRCNSMNVIVDNTEFKNCHANGAGGGGISYGQPAQEDGKLEITDSTFNGCYCNANKNGGAVLNHGEFLIIHEGTTGTLIDGSLNVSGVQFNANNGGGIYCDNTESEINNTTIRNCKAKTAGGGLYHSNKWNKSLSMKNCIVMNNTASTQGGVNSQGGGIYFYSMNNLSLDGCEITGNSSGTAGGGVYFNSTENLIIKNNTAVSGNKLNSGIVANAAGVYMIDNGILIVGDKETEEDTITIYDNKTNNGTGDQSNLRITRKKYKEVEIGIEKYKNLINETTPDITLYSNLSQSTEGYPGLIGVCTPGDPGTQFGLSDPPNRGGAECFVSDDGEMKGMIDTAPGTQKKSIIWYTAPVCQITDNYGNVLSYGTGTKTMAIFFSIKDAVAVYNNKAPGYFSAAPEKIEMLVSSYTMKDDTPALDKDCIFTTNSRIPRCTVTRNENVKKSMFEVKPGSELTITNVILDGGSQKDIKVSNSGGIITVNSGASLILGYNEASAATTAILQNASVTGNKVGGAVYVKGGGKISIKQFAVIDNCSSQSDGGGVYLGSGAEMTILNAATIKNCSSVRNGGAVYAYDAAKVTVGNSTNDLPSIEDNKVTSGDGAGIYLYGSNSVLNIQGIPNFDNNIKNIPLENKTNGGEPYPYLRQDIYVQLNTKELLNNIVVTGQITSGDGSIWVDTYNSEHYLMEKQFARIANNVEATEATLHAFRNAKDDDTDQNPNDSYLYGIAGEGENKRYVYWSGVSGKRLVLLRKITNGPVTSLEGAKFTVYRKNETTPYTVKDKDGHARELDFKISGKNGVFWVGELPYGIYVFKETEAPQGYSNNKWYKVVVNDEGVEITGPFDSHPIIQ